jgi:sugar lactone lactonase YvrE
VAAALSAMLVATVTAAQGRDRFAVELFARVPDPGSPEGIAIDSDRRVFVGTSPKDGGPLGAKRRSKVFVYDRRGELKRSYLIRGQDVEEPFYGLVGMAFDGRDRLYAADAAPPRIVRLNPRTGSQRTYARFRDVPRCDAVGGSRGCSETTLDMPALPDYPVFAAGGAMYVTDLNQALIWRLPPGGGKPKVWFTEPGLESLFGPNGIQFLADGRTLLFALSTEGNPAAVPQRPSGLYRLRVRDDGTPGRPRLFWRAGIADVPDGFAIARSGNVYVALAGTTGNAVAVISPDGEEIARTPPSELENQQMEVPFDQPASAAFLGEHVLVTNHALFSRNAEHYAVLDVFADERGLPLFRPTLDRRSPAEAPKAN